MNQIKNSIIGILFFHTFLTPTVLWGQQNQISPNQTPKTQNSSTNTNSPSVKDQQKTKDEDSDPKTENKSKDEEKVLTEKEKKEQQTKRMLEWMRDFWDPKPKTINEKLIKDEELF